MHGLYNRRTERLGDIANAKRNDIGFGMHGLEGIHLLSYVSEQIVVRQF